MSYIKNGVFRAQRHFYLLLHSIFYYISLFDDFISLFILRIYIHIYLPFYKDITNMETLLVIIVFENSAQMTYLILLSSKESFAYYCYFYYCRNRCYLFLCKLPTCIDYFGLVLLLLVLIML